MGSDAHETVRETQPFTRRNVVRDEVNRELRNRGLPDTDDEEELEEEEAQEIAAGTQVDVFDFCHPLVEKSEVVGYTIYKNSKFLAVKPHPYSWQDLQKEFGEGHYRVVAKSELTKRILKQQTSFVGPIQEKETPETVAQAVRAAMPPPVDQFDQIAKMATLLRSLQPPPPPPVEDKTSGVMVQFMQTVMQMQDKSQSQIMTLISEMQKSTTSMIEKISQSQKEALDKLESKLSTEKKDKGIDSLTLLSLLQEAEKRGMETWMKLDEMSERRAAKMTGNDEEKEPESATEKLIKTVLPGVVAAMSAPKPPIQQQVTAGAPIQRRRPQPAPAPAMPNPPPPSAQARLQPQPAAPSAQPAAPVVLPKVTKDQVMTHLMPIVLQSMMAADAVKTDAKAVAATQAQAAENVKVEVAKVGMTIPALLQLVGQGDIIDVATANNLPIEAHMWLKGFYANLEKLRTTGAGPVPAGNPQTVGPKPTNP